MEKFLMVVASFPTVLWSILLGVVCLYWLLAVIGMLDIDVLDLDIDIDADTNVEGLAGLMVTLGLTGVPLTIVFSLLVLLAWLVTYFVSLFTLSWFPGGWLSILLGIPVIVLSLLVAVPLTAQLIKPLKPLFKKLYHTHAQRSLVGLKCKIRSMEVTPERGEAMLSLDGADMILKVKTQGGAVLKNGETGVIVEHREAENDYIVVPEAEFEAHLNN